MRKSRSMLSKYIITNPDLIRKHVPVNFGLVYNIKTKTLTFGGKQSDIHFTTEFSNKFFDGYEFLMCKSEIKCYQKAIGRIIFKDISFSDFNICMKKFKERTDITIKSTKALNRIM